MGLKIHPSLCRWFHVVAALASPVAALRFEEVVLLERDEAYEIEGENLGERKKP